MLYPNQTYVFSPSSELMKVAARVPVGNVLLAWVWGRVGREDGGGGIQEGGLEDNRI